VRQARSTALDRTRPDAATLSHLLLLVHRMAGEPQRSQELLAAIMQAVDACHASIAICDGSGQYMHFLQFQPHMAQHAMSYEQQWSDQDPLRAAILRAEPDRFHARDALIPPARQQDDPYFTEWCPRWGFGDICIARLPLDADQQCLVSCVRTPRKPAFSRKELGFLDTLLPHIKRALALGRHAERLQILADIAKRRLLYSGQGVLVLDAEGRVAYMNAEGSELLQDPELFRLPVRRLQLADAACAPRFEELLSQSIALAGSKSILGGGAVSVPRHGRAPLLVSVLPYRHRDLLGTHVDTMGRAIVTLFDPSAPRADSRGSLGELYGLTPAEADVCWRLGNGDSVEQIADELGVSRETVRSQLKRVFAKTGTHRQAELLRLVLAGPVSWLPID
jgi:DNA-binding CsgD family transcriptional regulator/PAS domain-containing protein